MSVPTLYYYYLLEGIMPITYGQGPSAILSRGDDRFSVRDVLNNNMSLFNDFINSQEASIEQSNATLFGNGVVTGMVASTGAGLLIDVTSGQALLGLLIDYAGGTIEVPGNTTDSIYFGQDGAFYVGVEPTGMENFKFCDFTSDGSSVTNIDITTRDQEKVLPCRITKLTDNFDYVVNVGTTVEIEISHTTSLEIPGFVTLSSSSSDVTVEYCYPEKATPTSFWVRLYFNQTDNYIYYADYFDDDYTYPYYSGEPTTITWQRTGLAYY